MIAEKDYVTDDKDFPISLFKYMTLDERGNFRELFENNKLFCASPKLFNDPFDSKVFPNYHIGSNKEIKDKFIELEKEAFPNKSKKEILKAKSAHIEKRIIEVRDIEKSTKEYIAIIEKSYGICSLTEKNDDLLMWAHYSDKHKGFCVEFDASKLYQICKQYMLINELVLLKRMIYQKDYPKINPYAKSYGVKSFMECLLTKYFEWEYEREWRIVYAYHPNEYFGFRDDSILKGVYFGVNCDDNNIKMSTNILNKRKVMPKLYKANLKQKEFGIVFNEIK